MNLIKLIVMALLPFMLACSKSDSLSKSEGKPGRKGEARARLGSDKERELGKVTINQEGAFQGVTIYPVTGAPKVALISMTGEIVNIWNVDADRARLLPNGNLLVVHGSKWGRYRKPWSELRAKVAEYDWSGKMVWDYDARDLAHHDVRRLQNGNTIFLIRAYVPPKWKETVTDPFRRALKLRADGVLEVDQQGNIVWEWNAYEHLDLNSCGKLDCTTFLGRKYTKERLADWTHMNTVDVLPPNKWFEQGDTRFRPGNVIITARNLSTIYIIDRETKKIVWKYSGDYKGGLGAPHEAHMIEKGLPGAGNILIFDNGPTSHPGQTFALEVNPTSKEAVWIYDNGRNFLSPTRGSLQRLPNGNTLLSEDEGSRVFEVTPDKRIVWEFRGEMELSRASRHPVDYAPQLLRKPS